MEISNDYVLVFCTRAISQISQQVLFILKDRPAWQKGKLNLPGGRVEPGENPEDAAIRELKEETGLVGRHPRTMGIMKDRNFTIHCVQMLLDMPFSELKPREGETEKPMWIYLDHAMLDKRLLPNLRVIVPLMLSGTDGWMIEDTACSDYRTMHKISVTVPTFCEVDDCR